MTTPARPLASELATALSPAEDPESVARRDFPTDAALAMELTCPLSATELAYARTLGRFLCTVCLGTGKRQPSPRVVTNGREGRVSTGAALTATCGVCKGTGQRWRP